MSPAGQALEHEPQWPGSLTRFTQPIAGPQLVIPLEQVHMPEVQAAPGGQTNPHEPQSSGLVAVSTQPSVGPQLV